MNKYLIKLTGNDGFTFQELVEARDIVEAVQIADQHIDKLTIEQTAEVHARQVK